ncbi:MAG: hypothetical protein Kow00121_64640 [Elainellaceae cyanobacterium]
MTTATVRVFTHLAASSGQEAELRQHLLQVAEQRCQLSGCNSCDLLQHNVYPEKFILVEDWEIEARLTSDFTPESAENAYRNVEDLLATLPIIEWYEVIATNQNS